MSAKTALVVDDSKSARFALRKYLENQQFKVDTVDSAEEAYNFLREQRPRVIFLDHVMPGIDGLAALTHLKADPRTSTIPVVICSSNDGAPFIAEARDKGASDVLQKPPRPEQLSRILQTLPEAGELVRAADVVVPFTAPSKVSNIVKPEVAIEQTVMKTLRNAMQSRVEAPVVAPTPPPPPMSKVEPPMSTQIPMPPAAENQPAASFASAQTRSSEAALAALREQFEARMKRITQDVFVQLAELKGAQSHFEGQLAGREDDARQGVARHDALQDATTTALLGMQQRIDSVEVLLKSQLAETSAQLDAKLAAHAQRIEQITQAARTAAADEAHAVAERTMMSAATRIANQLANSILGRGESKPVAQRSE